MYHLYYTNIRIIDVQYSLSYIMYSVYHTYHVAYSTLYPVIMQLPHFIVWEKLIGTGTNGTVQVCGSIGK